FLTATLTISAETSRSGKAGTTYAAPQPSTGQRPFLPTCCAPTLKVAPQLAHVTEINLEGFTGIAHKPAGEFADSAIVGGSARGRDLKCTARGKAATVSSVKLVSPTDGLHRQPLDF